MRRTALLAASVVVLSAAAAWRASVPRLPDVQQQGVDTTIVIRSEGPVLEYVPQRIAAKHGLRVRVRYVNDGLLPHNIAFPRDEDDIDDLAAAAAAAASTGYVPLALKDKLFGYSALAKPGETVELVMTMPPPGEYRFVCLYPGHQNQMIGTLRSLR